MSPRRPPAAWNPAATRSARSRYSAKVRVRSASSISIGRSGLASARRSIRSQSVPAPRTVVVSATRATYPRPAGRGAARRWPGGRDRLRPMPPVHRVLALEPIPTLADYVNRGGGRGLEQATRIGPDAVLEIVTASGLGGRGGAGFPAGRKWGTVRSLHSPVFPSAVVINAAEGEPGSFKDRSILRANPYHVLEGALIAARTIGADRLIVGLKHTFTPEIARIRRALDELREAGWADGIALVVLRGPQRVPLRRGDRAARDHRRPLPLPSHRPALPAGGRGGGGVAVRRRRANSASAAHVEMAAPDGESYAPPTLASNVETLANVPGDPHRGSRLVPLGRHRGVARHDRLHHHRPHPASRRRRVRHGHAAA